MPSLTGREGTFVIELLGNGLYLKVIIKKGSLRYVSKITAGGHLISIFDENNKLCTQGGVYVDKQFYELGPKSYTIIPYAQSRSTKNIVLTDNNIYVLSSFQHYQENFELRCSFLLDNEELLVGKTANILIQPKLFINDVESAEFLVTDLKATISTMNTEGLSASLVYNNIKFSTFIIT